MRIFNIDGNVEQFIDKYSIEEIVNKTAIINIKEINETLNHLGKQHQTSHTYESTAFLVVELKLKLPCKIDIKFCCTF